MDHFWGVTAQTRLLTKHVTTCKGGPRPCLSFSPSWTMSVLGLPQSLALQGTPAAPPLLLSPGPAAHLMLWAQSGQGAVAAPAHQPSILKNAAYESADCGWDKGTFLNCEDSGLPVNPCPCLFSLRLSP